jgi:hypothetical protein
MLPQSPAAPPPRHRDPRSGAVKPLGVLAAMVIAGAVFGVGMLVLPSVEPVPAAPVELPTAPPPPPPSPAPPSPPEPAAGDAAPPPDAANPDAAPTAPMPARPSAPKPVAEVPAPRTKPEAEPEPAPEAKPEAKPTAEPSHDKLADKDVARDAWRKNLPDISPEAGKAAMLIPIKGSLEGAIYHVTVKPRNVLITLPKAESMITMPFYSVRHDGFRQLWIKKDEGTGATTIRVVLGDGSDPQVEIKDEFVRVTVRRPAPEPVAAPATLPGAAAAPTPAPAPADASAKPAPAPRGD